MIDDLTRLAILNGTDKFGMHDYTPVYYDLLRHLRDRPLRMLEIGVGGYGDPDQGGELLATWRDFFPQARIVGVDIQRKNMDLGPRVTILQGSQVDAAFLAQVVRDHGPFDIILDDGSHRNEHVVGSFEMLFPALAPGGIYIVEDTQTATFPKYGGSLDLTPPNMVGFFGAKAEALFRGRNTDDIAAIERFHNIIAIHKGDPSADALTAANDRHVARAGAGALDAAGDLLADPSAMNALIASLPEEGVVRITGSVEQMPLLQELFLQIDHRELRAYHPDAAIPDWATSLLSMKIYPQEIVLVVGDNDYPSNFAFDTSHPRVVEAMAVMADIVDDEAATSNGILRYVIFLRETKKERTDRKFLLRLADLNSTDRRYFNLALTDATDRKDWATVVRLGRQGLQHYPDDLRFVVQLARGIRFTQGLAAAHEMMVEAYQKSPDAAAIVNGLASLKIAMGDIDEGIKLHEKCAEMVPRNARSDRLRGLLLLCRNRNQVEAARRVARKLLKYAPDDPEALAVLEAEASR